MRGWNQRAPNLTSVSEYKITNVQRIPDVSSMLVLEVDIV